MKSNAIMEQLEKSDGNRHHRKNNINHFAPLYESDDEEGTVNRKKHKTTSIVLSEKGKGRKNEGVQNKRNEEDGNYWGKKTATEVYELNIDEELNR